MSNPVATYSTTNAAVLLAFLQLHIYMCELVRSLKPWGTRFHPERKKSSNQNLHNAAQTSKVRQCTSILPFRESILRKKILDPTNMLSCSAVAHGLAQGNWVRCGVLGLRFCSSKSFVCTGTTPPLDFNLCLPCCVAPPVCLMIMCADALHYT